MVISVCSVPEAAGQACAPDADFDGHPLFGIVVQRVDAQFADDGSSGGRAMTLDFGDLDGDGDLDVVSPYWDLVGEVGVLFNRGDGQFGKPIHYGVGIDPSHALLVDLDGDGDLDIAVSIDDDGTVQTLFNDGTGTFEEGGVSAVGERPRSMVAGDFDGNGHMDLAVLNERDTFVSILFNNGDGTFAQQVRVECGQATGRAPQRAPGPFLSAADLDGDGDLDLAVPSFFHVLILLNDGAGNFELGDHRLRSSELAVYAIEAGDLDGDGDQDLAASISSDRSLMAVWLNNGDGTFPEATIYDSSFIGDGAVYANPSISLGDMDNDGDLDAAMGHLFFGRQVIHRNNGDGTFAPYEAPLVRAQPWFVEWADLNGDGWLDLGTIAGLELYPIFIARLNDGAGNLFEFRNAEEDFPIAGYNAADSADLDGDGNLDLVVGSNGNESWDYRVLRGDGMGAFVERHRGGFGLSTNSSTWSVRFADMNGDEHLDLVFSVHDDQTSGFVPGSIWIALGLGGFEFGEPRRFETPDGTPFGFDAFDADGNGDLDLMVRVTQIFNKDGTRPPFEQRVLLFENDGDAALGIRQEIHLGDSNDVGWSDVVAADYDGDGDLDVLTSEGARRHGGPVYFLRNDGSGRFEIAGETMVREQAQSIVAGDWDGDGDLDAAAMHWRSEVDREYLTILDNEGAGNLSVTQTYTDTDIEMGNKLRVGDINGDGWPDLVLAANRIGVVVHLNDGRGGFADSAWYATNAPTGEPLIGDFDSDGDADILSPSSGLGGLGPIVLLENVACCRADLDGDGALTPEDFFLFLDRFSVGRADVDRDGDCDSDDFFGYLDLLSAGCS